MGGFGSGNRYRYRRKEIAEDFKGLDVRQLHRERLLYPGACYGWQWWDGENPSGDILIRVEQSRVILIYRYRFGSEEGWKQVEESVWLTRTSCNYGGTRPWFVCPGVVNDTYCGRRVAILYAAGEYFLCRHCYNLTYASRNENSVARRRRKAEKIRVKLGASTNMLEPIREKPKGMHWKTFFRLRRKLMTLEANVEGDLAMRFESFYSHFKKLLDI